jgi:hypothetical protein
MSLRQIGAGGFLDGKIVFPHVEANKADARLSIRRTPIAPAVKRSRLKCF